MSSSRKDLYERIIGRTVEQDGLEIVELAIPQSRRILLTVDSPSGEGVDIGTISHLHKAIGRALAEEGFAPELLHLEVQSPGLDRKLTRDKDFGRFAGQQVVVTLRHKREGRTRYRGELLGLEGACVVVDDRRDGRVEVERSVVKEVRLIPDL